MHAAKGRRLLGEVELNECVPCPVGCGYRPGGAEVTYVWGAAAAGVVAALQAYVGDNGDRIGIGEGLRPLPCSSWHKAQLSRSRACLQRAGLPVSALPGPCQQAAVRGVGVAGCCAVVGRAGVAGARVAARADSSR